MRQFRAYDEDTEVMYYSDEENEDCVFGFDKGSVVASVRRTEPQTIDEPAYDYGKLIDVEQYTGLRDCKRTKEYPEGQKIFEGDIVEVQVGMDVYKRYVVEFDSRAYYKLQGMSEKHQDGTFKSLDFCEVEDCELEVIGSIHTHPELVEAKDNAKANPV